MPLRWKEQIARLPQQPRAANTAVPSIQTQSRWSGMLDTYYAILWILLIVFVLYFIDLIIEFYLFTPSQDAMKVLPDDNSFSNSRLTKWHAVDSVFVTRLCAVDDFRAQLSWGSVLPNGLWNGEFLSQPECPGIELPTFFHHLDLDSIHPIELPGTIICTGILFSLISIF